MQRGRVRDTFKWCGIAGCLVAWWWLDAGYRMDETIKSFHQYKTLDTV